MQSKVIIQRQCRRQELGGEAADNLDTVLYHFIPSQQPQVPKDQAELSDLY